VAVLAIHGVLLIGLPLSGVAGYGDLPYFFQLVSLVLDGKLPFLHYWVEYPPLTPWLSQVLFFIGGKTEHGFIYLWAILLSLADVAVVWAMVRLRALFDPEGAVEHAWWYLALGFPFVMGWWNFDLLTLAFWLWGLVWLFERQEIRAGLFIAAGVLSKVFPLLTLPLAWKMLSRRRAARFSGIVVGALVLGLLPFALWSPAVVRASLLSQVSKGSSQTIWALIDGNLRTGIFGSVETHLDLVNGYLNTGQPARLDPRLTLLFFGGLGLWAFWRLRLATVPHALAFLGLTWGLFLLWSPAWSPQWVLYLAPLLLLSLQPTQGWLMAITLGLVSMLEWPLLLSRGLFQTLWFTTPLRTVVIALITVAFWQAIGQQVEAEGE